VINREYGDSVFINKKYVKWGLNIMNIKNKIFDIMVMLIILFTMLLCIVPLLHVIAISVSSNRAIISQKVLLFPVEFNLQAYKYILQDNTMIRSLFFTVEITILYTLVSMVMTICAAYPLTKKRLKGRSYFLFIIVFTMYFSGGLIPDYLLIKELNLINKVGSLILPGMISVFNLIVLKTFFSVSIPESIEESAYIEGCNDIQILVSVILPLSMPVLATVSLFYAVARWNGFTDALFYITDPKKSLLQMKLYQIVNNNLSPEIAMQEGVTSFNVTEESLKASSIVYTTLPILIVYPWLQKYFVTGIMIGAIKG
jgi:ABC-type sugar transport system, permease component